MSEHVAVATEIRRQIGARNLMAIGAREFVALNEQRGGLRMKVNRGQWVEVILTGRDTYDVTWLRVNRSTYARVVLGSRSDVYAEQLGETLYDLTQRGNARIKTRACASCQRTHAGPDPVHLTKAKINGKDVQLCPFCKERPELSEAWMQRHAQEGASRIKGGTGLSHVVAAKTRTQFDSRWRAAARRGEVDGFGGVEYHRELTAWKAGDESGMSLADPTYGGYLNLPTKGRTADRTARRAGAR